MHLAKHIETFRGMLDRLRCFLHCVQISANVCKFHHGLIVHSTDKTFQMVMSFFNKQYKRKKATGSSAAAPATGRTPATTAEADASAPEVLDAEEEELQEILDKDAEAETAAQAYERAIADAGQAEQDEVVISGIRQQAITEMAARGIVISASEQAAARKVLPKVHICYYELVTYEDYSN